MPRAGRSENIIMAIGAWQTPSVFKRYDIHDNPDNELALVALEQKRIADKARLDAEREAANDHSFGHNQASGPQQEAEAARGMVN